MLINANCENVVDQIREHNDKKMLRSCNIAAIQFPNTSGMLEMWYQNEFWIL